LQHILFKHRRASQWLYRRSGKEAGVFQVQDRPNKARQMKSKVKSMLISSLASKGLSAKNSSYQVKESFHCTSVTMWKRVKTWPELDGASGQRTVSLLMHANTGRGAGSCRHARKGTISSVVVVVATGPKLVLNRRKHQSRKLWWPFVYKAGPDVSKSELHLQLRDKDDWSQFDKKGSGNKVKLFPCVTWRSECTEMNQDEFSLGLL
jgi:hypothetical protein